MKKRYVIIFSTIIIVGVGCYFIASGTLHKNHTSVTENSIENKQYDKVSEICSAYTEISNLLSKSSKGSENNMAKFLGLSDILNSIADEASTAISKSEDITVLIKNCKDEGKLEIYNKDIQSFKDNFARKSDIIKNAKQDRNVDNLTQALKDMLQLVNEYNSYLDKVLDEMK
ncbi:hypothetical protein [Clostridium omnivorum]|uniref:Lipoprotein n=1 Tax=Clostridium omnivorum TaxID=1604902 RepID=A0ABQ5N965_9CLOT|nr:hypothetical protein [Clostridium sp. E14]GLC31763.1 hypothetical protein bsdE14_31730 [Clostridium sp. E14]